MPQESSVSLRQLILIPGLVTLGVTILRLVGELQNWSSLLFNPMPGGGGAPVGIVWLVPVFGIYFALKLASSGDRPSSLGKAAGFSFLGLLALAGGLALFGFARFQSVAMLAGAVLMMAASIVIAARGWASLTKALLVYGYVARIPVTIVMFFAIRGDWGTHYDGPPPGFPAIGWLGEFFLTGVIPQLAIWIAFTVIVGSLLGIAAVAILRRKAPAAATT